MINLKLSKSLNNLNSFILSILILNITSLAFSQENNDIKRDYAFVTGLTAGLIKDPNRNEDIIVGGLPFGWRITSSHNSSLSSTYQLSALLDFGNAQFVKYSGEIGFSFHLLGGSRYVKKVSSIGTIIGTSPYDLSLAIRSSYSQFSISSPNDHLDRVKGSTVDFKTGIEYRLDIMQSAAIGIEALITIIGFPASVDRLSHTGFDLNIVWRAEI